ncbi:MAG TPA: AAA family ATPase [Chloroflexota bacterium]|nr:AAA family ATPase [Chloroflexota bacterium]
MTPLAPIRFSLLLKHFRLAAGLTQEALAERARMSKRGVQDLERGLRQRPRRDTVELLAAALALSGPDRAEFLAAAQERPIAVPDAAVSFTPAIFTAGTPAPIVGRARELDLLSHFLAGRSDGLAPPPVMLLAGEPGIGKTRLLQAFARQAAAGGWCVLAGGCQRRGGQEPYVPLVEALTTHVHALEPLRRREALAGCAWLGRLLPELEAPAGAALPPDQERRRIYEAMGRFLTNVAGPAGTLLLLDDLQWAGPDALDLVQSLARQATARLRIVGAYRDTETRPPDPLNLLLTDLAQARLVHRLPLGPLNTRDAALLLADLLADVPEENRAMADRALERAGGVPFFLVSYAQALAAGATEGIPWDLAQGVSQRVALLPEAARQVLHAAAIVGRRVPRGLLAATARQSEEDALAGLEVACRARLILEDGDEGYLFAHDVIREVVEADMGAAWRAALHHRAGEALERGPAGAAPELLAYHFARGGDPDKSVYYLELAGDRAWGQRAHGAAEGHYREVLERLEPLEWVQAAARVREKLGEVLHGVGRHGAALAVLAQAAAAYDVGSDLEGVVRVTAAMGWTHRFQGTPLKGIALITALLERLERGSAAPPPLATLYQALGRLLFTDGQYDASLAATERASTLARAHGDDRTLALAEAHQINILQTLGRLTDALRIGQEVLPLAERVGALRGMVGLHIDVGYIHALQGAFAAGRRSLDQGLARAEQLGNPAVLAFALALRGWIAVLSGAWTSARADLDQAVSVSSQSDRSWYSAYLPIFRARLSLAEGAWDAAAAQAQDALALSEGSSDLQALRWASTTLAEVDLLEGRPEAARDRLIPLLDRDGLEECDVTTLLPVLALAYLELGDADQAAGEVARAMERARPEGMRLVMVEALRVQAMIALRQERWGEAERCLEEGITLARAMPYPAAEARLLQLEVQLREAAGRTAS